MAPSVCDDPPEASLSTAAVADDCFRGLPKNSSDDTFETASLTLDHSRSDDDDDDYDVLGESYVLQEPTGDERLLRIMDGSEEEMKAAVEESWQQHSKEIWDVEQLRPIQMEALWHIVEHPSLLLVSRTGSGKTHFVRMMGTVMGGIVVVVVPLLALMADQMTKMKSTDGRVEAYNVDQLQEEAGDFIDEKLIPRLNEMKEGTTSTVFLFVSPHYLTRHSSMVDAIVDANGRNALCAIGIDEVHLYALHSNFRMCIRLLEDMLWKRIYTSDNKDSWPKFFAMSATVTEEIINDLTKLVGGAVDLGPSMRIWPCRDHYEQRSITHSYYTRGGNNPFQVGVKAAVDMITSTPNLTALLFTTLASSSIKLIEQVERALNKAKCPAHMVHVNGGTEKYTKFMLLQLLNEHNKGGFNLRGMVSTGAANTGIDLTNVRMVVRCGIPPDIITLLQERGRLARESGATGQFILIGNIDSVAEQMWLIYNSSKKEREDSEEQRSFTGANSAVYTDRGRAAAARNGSGESDEDKLCKLENKLKPKGREITMIRERAEKQLHDVLDLIYLDKGCQHVRCEQYCADGKLRSADLSVEPCGNSCPVCMRCRKGKRQWDEMFHKLDKLQVIAFLESRIVQDAFPLSAASGSLANLLWNSEDWILKIFHEPKKKIPKHMVESAFLQLIAGKIIVTEYDTKVKQLKWVLNRTGERLCYKIDSYWIGINIYQDNT